MNNSKDRGIKPRESKGQRARRRMYFHMLILALVFAALAAAVYILVYSRLVAR